MQTLDQLFNSTEKIEFLSPATEARLIKAAQGGSEYAFEELLKAFMPVIKRMAGKPPSNLDRDDVRSTLLLAFTEAVNDAEDSLSLIINNYLVRALSELGIEGISHSIPPRTLSRFLSIVRKADGDIALGAEIASQHSMKRTTFISIYEALRLNGSYEELLEGAEHEEITIVVDDPGANETNEYLVDQVVEVRRDENDLTNSELEVIYLAYGFDILSENKTDHHVAHILGTTRSRVQRLRAKALGKARDRLGL